MLYVSEQFFSIQGEGPTAGTPAIFLRLKGCNLLCAWPCDTIEVWQRGDPVPADILAEEWQRKGWFNNLRTDSHLVVTGGEPLLQMDGLEDFFRRIPETAYIEVETNGTIPPSAGFDGRVSQYNVSPK